MKMRILVGDDQPGLNQKAYEALFNSPLFEYVLAKNSTEFLALLAGGKYDAVVVDVNLDKWGLKLAQLCQDIPDRKPVVLASGAWNEGKTHQQISDVLAAAKDVAFVGTVILSELKKRDEAEVENYANSARGILQLAIARQQQRSSLQVGDNEPLRILHVSDTQFGDPGVDAWSFEVGAEISRYVQQTLNQKIHLLALTGDIAYSGSPTEYEKALEELDRLAEKLWPSAKDRRERILLVPGNHDANLRLAAADKVDYSFRKKKVSINSENKETAHRKYSLAPFRDFAWRLTGANNLMDDNALCWICDSYRHLGVRIHLLNSAGEIDCDAPNVATVPKAGLAKLSKTVHETEDQIFNLALCHHGAPNAENIKTAGANVVASEPITNWPQVAQYFKHAGVRLLLHGHGHARLSRKVEYSGSGERHDSSHGKLSSNEFIEVMAPTSHLGAKLRPVNQRRGFNVVELIRNNGRVTEVKIDFYELRENNPTPMNDNGKPCSAHYVL